MATTLRDVSQVVICRDRAEGASEKPRGQYETSWPRLTIFSEQLMSNEKKRAESTLERTYKDPSRNIRQQRGVSRACSISRK